MPFILCNSRARLCNNTWVGNNNIINSVIPGNSRPLNVLVDNDIMIKAHVPFKANPIKHWRKQLLPQPGSGIGNKGTLKCNMDKPGGTVKITGTDCSIYSNVVKTYIHSNSDTCSNDCNRKKIIRSAKTIIDKKYYTTSSAYLKSRVKTYNQNQIISLIDKNNPSSGYNSVYCSDVSGCNNCPNKCFIKVNYKPNNASYSQQGAVSNDLRISNLKYKTLETNKCLCPSKPLKQSCNKYYINVTTDNFSGKVWRKSLICSK